MISLDGFYTELTFLFDVIPKVDQFLYSLFHKFEINSMQVHFLLLSWYSLILKFVDSHRNL